VQVRTEDPISDISDIRILPHVERRTPAYDAIDVSTGLCVRVTVNDAPRVGYSFHVGTLTGSDDERYPGFKLLRPFCRVTVDFAASATVRTKAGLVCHLMEQAEDWIVQDAQKRLESFRLDKRIEREQADIARQKPRQAAGLKTLAKRDTAAKGYGPSAKRDGKRTANGA
jgi:hypothetical protein